MGSGMTWKRFAFLFVGCLSLEVALVVSSSISSNSDQAFWYAPLWPAIWVTMVVGGVHSAGIVSFVIGFVIIAALYSGVVLVLWTLFSKVNRLSQ